MALFISKQCIEDIFEEPRQPSVGELMLRAFLHEYQYFYIHQDYDPFIISSVYTAQQMSLYLDALAASSRNKL